MPAKRQRRSGELLSAIGLSLALALGGWFTLVRPASASSGRVLLQERQGSQVCTSVQATPCHIDPLGAGTHVPGVQSRATTVLRDIGTAAASGGTLAVAPCTGALCTETEVTVTGAGQCLFPARSCSHLRPGSTLATLGGRTLALPGLPAGGTERVVITTKIEPSATGLGQPTSIASSFSLWP